MCGGIKNIDSAKYHHLVRGRIHNFNIVHGNKTYSLKLKFEGHCRIETFNQKWAHKAHKLVGIEVAGFAERDTVHKKFKEFEAFRIPSGKVLAGVIMKDNSLRMMTHPATPPIDKVHNRMPLIVSKDNLAFC